MRIGKALRLKRIFAEDGKSLVVAMDHAAIIGPKGALANPQEMVEKVIAGRPDAILTTKGMLQATHTVHDPDVAVILRISGGFTMLGDPTDFQDRIISSVEQAIKYGADGVAITVKYGHKNEGQFIERASFIADSCSDWGIPLMVEVWPAGPNVKDPSDLKAVKLGSRAAAEIGADIVKTYYTGSKDSFAEVSSGCPIPVVILGGAKGSTEDLFKMIAESLAGGSAGVAMGRNVWGHEDPKHMVEAINGLIHKGWAVDEALESLAAV